MGVEFDRSFQFSPPFGTKADVEHDIMQFENLPAHDRLPV